MDEIVKARYLGPPASMRIETDDPDDAGHEIELLPRHHYDLPRSTVEGRDDFKIIEQEDEVADETPEKPREDKETAAEAHGSLPRSKSRPMDTERATDRAPREEG